MFSQNVKLGGCEGEVDKDDESDQNSLSEILQS